MLFRPADWTRFDSAVLTTQKIDPLLLMIRAGLRTLSRSPGVPAWHYCRSSCVPAWHYCRSSCISRFRGRIEIPRRSVRPYWQSTFDNQRHGLVDRNMNRTSAVFKGLLRVEDLLLALEKAVHISHVIRLQTRLRKHLRIDLPGILHFRAGRFLHSNGLYLHQRTGITLSE